MKPSPILALGFAIALSPAALRAQAGGAEAAALADSIARIDRKELFYFGGRSISRDDLEAFLQQLAVTNALTYDYDESIRGIRETMREIASETASRRGALSARLSALGPPSVPPPVPGSTPDSPADGFLARARPMSRERSCQLRNAFRARGTPGAPDCDSAPAEADPPPSDPPAEEIEAALVEALLPPAGMIVRRIREGAVRLPRDPGALMDETRNRAATALYGRGFEALGSREREIARALASVMNFSVATTRDGSPAFPGVTASMPIVSRLAGNARTDPGAYVALMRYTALLVRMDAERLGSGAEGPALP